MDKKHDLKFFKIRSHDQYNGKLPDALIERLKLKGYGKKDKGYQANQVKIQNRVSDELSLLDLTNNEIDTTQVKNLLSKTFFDSQKFKNTVVKYKENKKKINQKMENLKCKTKKRLFSMYKVFDFEKQRHVKMMHVYKRNLSPIKENFQYCNPISPFEENFTQYSNRVRQHDFREQYLNKNSNIFVSSQTKDFQTFSLISEKVFQRTSQSEDIASKKAPQGYSIEETRKSTISNNVQRLKDAKMLMISPDAKRLKNPDLSRSFAIPPRQKSNLPLIAQNKVSEQLVDIKNASAKQLTLLSNPLDQLADQSSSFGITMQNQSITSINQSNQYRIQNNMTSINPLQNIQMNMTTLNQTIDRIPFHAPNSDKPIRRNKKIIKLNKVQLFKKPDNNQYTFVESQQTLQQQKQQSPEVFNYSNFVRKRDPLSVYNQFTESRLLNQNVSLTTTTQNNQEYSDIPDIGKNTYSVKNYQNLQSESSTPLKRKNLKSNARNLQNLTLPQNIGSARGGNNRSVNETLNNESAMSVQTMHENLHERKKSQAVKLQPINKSYIVI